MLLEMKKQLKTAEGLFLEMSVILTNYMLDGYMSPDTKERWERLDGKRQIIVNGVIDTLKNLYPDINITPVTLEQDQDFIVYMDQNNQQLEKLEKIINMSLSNCNLNTNWRIIMKNINSKEEFNRKSEEEQVNIKRPNILIAGYTGCGKSALMRTIIGDAVPKEAVDDSKPCRIDFDCYENENIRLWDSRGLELGDAEADFCERMRDFVAERQEEVDVDDHIHLIWYLIPGNGARVTDCDLELLKNIFTADNVIPVISKCDITKPEQLKAISAILMENGIPESSIIAVSDSEGGAINCKELVELSCQMLPGAYRDAFIAAQSIDREARAQNILERSERAREMIAKTIIEVEQLVEDPIQVSNTAEVTKVLTFPFLEMTVKLAALYGIRDKAHRAAAAQFANDVVGGFAQALQEMKLDSDATIGKQSVGILTGALGHYFKNNFEAFAVARARATALPELGFDLKQFQAFFQSYKQGASMKPNILICGKTGVGKTSLIQAVTHRGVVPDSAIGNGKATTVGLQLYETEIANFIDAEGMSPGTQSVEEYADFILNELIDRLDADEEENIIHNIWYCIDGSAARIQEADKKLIQTMGEKVILVVTKSELIRKEQTEAMMKTLPDLIDRDRIVFVSAENKTGLSKLIGKAESISAQSMKDADNELSAFRDRWDDYYANMKSNWTQCVSSDADSYINWGAGRAATIALIPLPLADVAPLIANEVYMIYKLAGVYGIAVDSTVITMLLGCAGSSIMGKIGASFLPFLKVPIAAAVTYGVGKATKAYFESEMTLSPSELKAEFIAGEREAKKRDWKSVNAE